PLHPFRRSSEECTRGTCCGSGGRWFRERKAGWRERSRDPAPAVRIERDTADLGAGDQASRDDIADLEAFHARLPLEAFGPIALAMGVFPNENELKALRSWLVPEFYLFYLDCGGKQRPRAERLSRLQRLRDATAVVRASLSPGGAWQNLPGGLLLAADED